MIWNITKRLNSARKKDALYKLPITVAKIENVDESYEDESDLQGQGKKLSYHLT